jgi:hypothetical protein
LCEDDVGGALEAQPPCKEIGEERRAHERRGQDRREERTRHNRGQVKSMNIYNMLLESVTGGTFHSKASIVK